MSHIHQLIRLMRIGLVLVRFRLDELVYSTGWFKPLHFLFYLAPWHWRKKDDRPVGVRLRLALQELGPIYVKFGQMLSTRRDLLPDEVANELAKLQDKVAPFESGLAKDIIVQSLGADIHDVFSEFEQEPLASASVAQVHAAKLVDGSDVVVKVLRPGIAKVIQRDIHLLHTIAAVVEKSSDDGKRLRPKDVVSEFEKVIWDELDLQREAANASQLRRNFEDSHMLYVPQIYWPYVRKNVLVMERIYGIPVSDIDRLLSEGVDIKLLAEKGVEIFFTQVFRDCFFHADMHPGNIFVSVENPADPQYIAVDFGIIGTLNPEDQRYLAENFLAFFHRDYRRVAELHVESGWVPSETRVDEFEAAIRTLCEPIFERPLKDISFGLFLLHLFQTARRFNMEVQPQLVLLQKTLLSIEGLGRMLYPELDLWKTAKPFMEDWMRQQMSAKKLFKRFSERAAFWSDKLPILPELIYHSLEQQEMSRRMAPSDKSTETELQSEGRATLRMIFGATLMISGTVMLVSTEMDWIGFSTHYWGAISAGVGLMTALWTLARNR